MLFVSSARLGEVMTDRNARYARAAALRLENGDTLTTPLLPGIELPLEGIFARG